MAPIIIGLFSGAAHGLGRVVVEAAGDGIVGHSV